MHLFVSSPDLSRLKTLNFLHKTVGRDIFRIKKKNTNKISKIYKELDLRKVLILSQHCTNYSLSD